MQPAFVSDDVWAVIPDDARSQILHESSAAVRRGEPQRTAFWSAVRGKLEQDLFEDFEVDRTYGEFAWPMVFAQSGDDLNRVTEVLIAAKAAAGSVTTVTTKSSAEFWLELGCRMPEDRCVYCGHSLKFGEVADDELSVHAGCVERLRTLQRVLHATAVTLSGQQSDSVDVETEEKPSEPSAPEADRRQPPALPENSPEEPSVDDLLSMFEGEALPRDGREEEGDFSPLAQASVS